MSAASANAEPILRPMRPDEFDAVAALICASTNAWYQKNRGFEAFAAGPASCRLFPETYEALDPGCCVVAEDAASPGRLLGSCFYHPRDTHVSLGIMNVSPAAFGRGVASRLLRFVTGFADRANKPVRLVSSAMNLDSFSTYSRAGFVPRATFADMTIAPESSSQIDHPDLNRVRPATPADLPAILRLEERVSGIRREKDHRFFVDNRQGIWHALVYEGAGAAVEGFLVSVHHPASHMLGPGATLDDRAAAALIAAQLKHHAGRSPIFLTPLDRPALVRQMYAWGARNVELHFAQVRGDAQPARGVVMPTFMPETA
jgi:ribosomal protein S18 acetylase RimI-like enzyme